MPHSVQSCSGTCPVKLWVSPRMEIIQHSWASWGPFCLDQWHYTKNAIARKARSSGWAVKCLVLVLSLWLGCVLVMMSLETLTRCAVAIFVRKWSGCQFTSLLESATGLKQGLKEELCVCIGPMLIPADWFLQPQTRNRSAGNYKQPLLLPSQQVSSSLGYKYLNLQRETMRSPIISESQAVIAGIMVILVIKACLLSHLWTMGINQQQLWWHKKNQNDIVWDRNGACRIALTPQSFLRVTAWPCGLSARGYWPSPLPEAATAFWQLRKEIVPVKAFKVLWL